MKTGKTLQSKTPERTARPARQADVSGVLASGGTYDLLPVATFTLDRRGTIIETNPAGASLVAAASGTLEGQSFNAFIPKTHHPDFNAFLSRLFSPSPPPSCTCELELASAPSRIMQVTACSTPDGTRCHMVFTDITQHKRDEAIQQARLRLLEFAASHTLHELLTATLDEAERLTGSQVGFYHFIEADQNTLTLQAWSTRTTREMCKAEGKNRHYPLRDAGVWADSVREHKPVIHNDYAALPHRKGLPQGHAPVIRELSVPIFRDDKVVAILGLGNKATDYGKEDVATVSLLADLAWDITERKRSEETIREAIYFLEESQKAALIGSYNLDFSTGYWKSSLVLNRIFGLDGKVNRTIQEWMDIVHPDDRAMINGFFKDQTPGKRQQFDKEYRIMRQNDGQMRWVHGLGTLTSTPENTPLSMIGVVQDVTERKQLEAEKARIEVQYQHIQKAESLSRMAGAIAHNFNNQLQAMLGNLELAINVLPAGSKIHEHLAEAMLAGRKAADLSGQMLAYLGQIPGRNNPIDLCDTCRQHLPALRSGLPKLAELVEDIPASRLIVKANQGQIQQILGNLITNAWEALDPRPGSIHLTLRSVPGTQITTSNRFPTNWQPHLSEYACLEVRDTGCGIAEHDIENIFDPFFTSKFTGRGLGLPVVLGIVRSHGGGIAVDSAVGQGTTFRIYLPLAPDTTIQHAETPTSPPEIRGHGIILVVEDQADVRKVAKTTLTRLGFAVLEAQDGSEAIEIFKLHKHAIRCVLCDLTMKRMDGWSTLSALRQISPDIPTILCSGYNQAEVMTGEHEEWPQIFLHKPYQAAELRDAVRQVLFNKTTRGRNMPP